MSRFSCFKTIMLMLLLSSTAAEALAAQISALRSWRAPTSTRLVLDLSAPVSYRISPDSSPARLIVELDDAQLAGPLDFASSVGPLKVITLEPRGTGLRLLIDTSVELNPRIFQLPPNERYGHRLVLDLDDKPATGLSAPTTVPASAAVVAAAIAAGQSADQVLGKPVEKLPQPAESATPAQQAAAAAVASARPASGEDAMTRLLSEKAQTNAQEKSIATPPPAPGEKAGQKPAEKTLEKMPEAAKPSALPAFDVKRYRNIIVAIDAGHGGEDPGASGAHGSREKDITLSIARELQAQLNAEPGISAVLTRSGDYFIPLQERRRIARYQHKADIFISIHADAAPSRAAHGASVFALSLKGANTASSRFARMLAERENRADLIGGAAIESGDDVLRNVLADMVVAGSLEHSLHMGRTILGGLDRVGSLHSRHVEQAGFAVLKEPGMVSLLVETGFISNPDEEKKLNDRDYQRQLARAVFDGVRHYCLQYPVPGSYFAWKADAARSGAVAAAGEVSGTGAVTMTASAAKASTVAEPATAARKDRQKTRYKRHKVQRGENLTQLAGEYRVTLDALREANRLRDDTVRVGQVLKIPVN